MNKTSFFSKKPISCPVCGSSFHREEMLTGSGRLIAGNLTEELRRLYEVNKKFGEVNPLVYPITVCPSCFFAAYPADFSDVPVESVPELKKNSEKRVAVIRPIFPELEFREPRSLKEGVAAYYFALMCYDYFPKFTAPTIKQGLSSLRAAWLCNDLHTAMPNENYDYMARLFYRKARFFYTLAVEYESDGTESLGNAGNLGPDLDKNYGYDGVLYLASYLEYMYGPQEDPEKREKSLHLAKRIVARIFGMGKATKSKPEAILNCSRDLFDSINEALKEFGGADA
ncbi:DUF2225 domain-containing protein [Marispirochaeta aestuarii]|uniref:DUF2225 domain-containing protein n=1 Tax=Marispirochaeta aestuarii TaxID=1963862 RepID=UPI0029C76560|nr:DUF2225 domain-containing protein [Marispirochaeta aestuarii]